MRPGTEWVYDDTSGGARMVLDRRIEDTLKNVDGLVLIGYSEDVKVNNPPSTRAVAGYHGHRGGTIYEGLVYGDSLRPKSPILASPIAAGHRWWTDAGGLRDSFEIVAVTPGQFKSQPIDTVVIVRRWNSVCVDSIWFGRSIGIMRRHLTNAWGGMHRTLRTFTPGL